MPKTLHDVCDKMILQMANLGDAFEVPERQDVVWPPQSWPRHRPGLGIIKKASAVRYCRDSELANEFLTYLEMAFSRITDICEHILHQQDMSVGTANSLRLEYRMAL